jgi:hypothetical protein
MALHFIQDKERPDMGALADRRLYLSADKACVVEEGDPRAAFLFVAPGAEITNTDLVAYGLTVEGGIVALPAEAKMADVEPENKMAPAPANKGRKRGSR